MILKPHKPAVIIELIVDSLMMAFQIYFLVVSFNIAELFLLFLAGTLLVALLLIKKGFAHFRTIEIKPDGCTVKFLFYKKQYAWSDLKTVRVEIFSTRLTLGRTGSIYTKGIIFSTKENFRTPNWSNISTYLIFCINPFHFFPAFFEEYKYRSDDCKYYEVKEKPFMELLQEYGVEVLK